VIQTSRDWDARTYDRVSDPQFRWALEQLERLEPLRGDEVLLDAGCGSGRVTAELVRRLARGRVYGVDVAPSMAAHAQAALGDSATILCQDLLELELPEPVEIIFSNATFHWIDDHDRLFSGLHHALESGGRLVAQCGGAGNIASFLGVVARIAAQDPFASALDGWDPPGTFATPDETAARLEAVGFKDVECWLEPKRVTLADPRPFVETVCLVRHLDVLPPGLKEPFLDAVLSAADKPLTLEYVRLNMTGGKP
jgi:trans-aconitate 2-methyltransferase